MKKFLKELPKNFREIGQVAPSSKALAQSLSKPLRELSSPRRILEVGAGTGSITREIISALRDGDELIVCEINSRLLELLELDLRDALESHKGKVRFVNAPVQELRASETEGSFSIIVSSLPFTNFSPDLVREILELYAYLLQPGGFLSFYEYVGLRPLGQFFRNSSDRARVKAVGGEIERWKSQRKNDGALSSSVTLLNLPPARTLVGRY